MAKRRSAEANNRIKENYNRLREAGLTPTEAARLRNASEAKLNATIAAGERVEPISERRRRAGAGERMDLTGGAGPVEAYGTHKGRIKEDDYKDVTLGYGKMYTDFYAYVMTYIVRNRFTDERVRKYYTILSPFKRTKQSLKEEVITNVEENDNLSEDYWELIKSSIQLVEAYYNPNPERRGGIGKKH